MIVHFLFYKNLQENKLKRLVELGKLSRASINKAKKAGLFKPYKEWQKGFEKGTKNIIKKSGYKVRHNAMAPTMSNIQPQNKTIHLFNQKALTGDKFISASAAIKRHEATEATGVSRFVKDKKTWNKVTKAMYNNPTSSSTPFAFTGGHAHPNVIKNETKYINTMRRVYKDPKPHRVISPFRTSRVTKEMLKPTASRKHRKLFNSLLKSLDKH